MSKRYSIIITVLSFVSAMIIAGFAIIVPGMLIKNKARQATGITFEVPMDMYIASKTALSKHSSSLLTPMQRIRIISENTGTKLSSVPKNSGLNEVSAVKTAASKIAYLYDLGLYPTHFSSGYDNWYSHKTVLYEYTDTIYNTYTCYMWKITFTKYDNSEVHTILMTEDGIILFAGCPSMKASVPEGAPAINQIYCNLLFGNNMYCTTTKTSTESLAPVDTYYDPLKEYAEKNNGESNDAYTAYNLQMYRQDEANENYILIICDNSLTGYNICFISGDVF